MDTEQTPREIKLSVVIPALNEGANLELLIPSLRLQLAFLHDNYEIIVVNGDSTDNTMAVVEKLGIHLVQQQLPGYGGALRAGFAAARGGAIMTMDADLSHPPVFIESMFRSLPDAEVVIASRYIPGGSADMPKFRGTLSRTLNVFFARGLALQLKDISSGFRLYRADVIHELDLCQNDFSILEEIIVKIANQGYRIIEIPFHYEARGKGQSKAKIIRFGINYMRLFLKLRRTRKAHITPYGR